MIFTSITIRLAKIVIPATPTEFECIPALSVIEQRNAPVYYNPNAYILVEQIDPKLQTAV